MKRLPHFAHDTLLRLAALMVVAATFGVICCRAQDAGLSEQAEIITLPRSPETSHLLFTFVTSRSGFDTEIVISNTSEDEFGTTPRAGACTIHYEGSLIEGAAPGDQMSSVIEPGKQLIFTLSNGNEGEGISGFSGFQGFLTASCDFPLARGTARLFLEDDFLVSPLQSLLEAEVISLPRHGAGPSGLLFPFVTSMGGFDTSIVIANTAGDGFGTTAASGSCELHYHGVNVDGKEVEATDTSSVVAAGGQLVFTLSNGNEAAAIAGMPGFRGYLIAKCGFPLARGTALFDNSAAAAGAGVLFAQIAEVLDLKQPRDPQPRALLFHPVSAQGGLGTQIVIANTSLDELGLGTSPKGGTCTISYYGQMEDGGAVPAPQVTPAIPPGGHFIFALRPEGDDFDIPGAPGLQGYVIAQCEFPLARGLGITTNDSADEGGPAFGTTASAEVLLTPRDGTARPLLLSDVSNQNFLDSEIFVSNTTRDPLGTTPASGPCTISYHGETAGGGAAPASQTSVPIPAGRQLSFSLGAGNPSLGIAPTPRFRGYLFANCGFPIARGFALSTGPVETPVLFSVSTDLLDFGDVVAGLNKTLTFNVEHIEGELAALAAESTDPQFTVVAGFASGATTSYSVTFAPAAASPASGQVKVMGTEIPDCCSTPGVNAVPINLRGAGRPALTVNPTSLVYGTVLLGGDATLPLTVIASQALPADSVLTITLMSNNPSFSVPESLTLAPGESATAPVIYAPLAAGAAIAIITLSAAMGDVALGSATVPLIGSASPVLSVSQSLLDFGAVPLGCSETRSFRATPNAPGSFAVTSAAAEFDVSPKSFSGGESQLVEVTFTPSTPGAVASQVAIQLTGEFGTPPGAAVAVTGTGSEIAIAPAVVEFGEVPVGTTASKAIQFSASPDAPFPWTRFAAFTSDPIFNAVGPNRAGSAEVTFTPTREGAFSAEITYRTTSPCSLFRTVQVNGAGVTLELSLTPSLLDFGALNLPRTSTLNATLVNNGNVDFTGSASTNNGAFRPSPANFSLGAGESQTFAIAFEPNVTGNFAGNVLLHLNGSGFTHSLTLPVSGQAMRLAFSPPSLTFGVVPIGSPESASIVVSNQGASSVPLKVSTANAAFAASPDSFTLAAGSSQAVSVTFSPAGTGAVESSAEFSFGSGSHSVPLSGTGGQPTLSFQLRMEENIVPVDPGGSIQLPPTVAGLYGAAEFLVTNVGARVANVNTVGTSGGAFAVTGLPALPRALAPDQTLRFTIEFRPQSKGRISGGLLVNAQAFGLAGEGLPVQFRILGESGNVEPLGQEPVGVALETHPAGSALAGQLTLTFTPGAGLSDDPAVQFAFSSAEACRADPCRPAEAAQQTAHAPGRCVAFAVPAGSGAARFTDSGGGVSDSIGLQTGTVAGDIVVRASLEVSDGADVTPCPAPTVTLTIPGGPPVITELALVSRSSTGFSVAIQGYAVRRAVNSVGFAFSASDGANLQTTQVATDVRGLVSGYYDSAASEPFGSQFRLELPFNVQGPLGELRSVTVTLASPAGTSAPATANF